MKSRILLSMFFALAVFCLVLAGCKKKEQEATDSTNIEVSKGAPTEMGDTAADAMKTVPVVPALKIAVVGPYTGDLASYGIPVKNAAQLAATAINEAGGVLGRKLELLIEDDVCEPNTATNVANKLISEGVHAVVGHLCSGATEATLAIYKNANIMVVSAGSTTPSLTLSGQNPNFFRTIAHDAAQANLQTNYAIQQLKIKKAAVIHDKGAYGKGLAELVKANLEKASIPVSLFEGVTPGEMSYSALINKLNQAELTEANGGAVFFGGYHPEASKIVTEARKKKITAYFISGDGVKDPAFLKIAGEYAVGYYVSAPTDVSLLPMAQRVTAAYKNAYGTDPGTFSLQGYAAVQAIANAIAKAGSTDLQGMLAAMHSSHVETPLGNILFDQNGDIMGAGFAMFRVAAEGFTPVQFAKDFTPAQ